MFEFPPPVTFPAGEMTGQFLEPRIIDEGMSNLTIIAENLLKKSPKDFPFNDDYGTPYDLVRMILTRIINVRAFLWYSKLNGTLPIASFTELMLYGLSQL